MGCAVLLLALSVIAAADDAQLLLPHRTTLAVQLDTSIKTKHAHAGDPVRATLMSPVLLHGIVVVPKAARVRGRVLVVQAHDNGVNSRLIVRFEEMQWADRSAPLNAYIVHQIIEKRVLVSNVDGGCSPTARDTGTVFGGGSTTSQATWSGCPAGSAGEVAEQKTVFTTPAMKDVTVRRSRNPAHTIELTSTKDFELRRGTLLELRHLAPTSR